MKDTDIILMRLVEPDSFLLLDRNSMTAGVLRKVGGDVRVTRKVAFHELTDLAEAEYLLLVINTNLVLGYKISPKGRERVKEARQQEAKRRQRERNRNDTGN